MQNFCRINMEDDQYNLINYLQKGNNDLLVRKIYFQDIRCPNYVSTIVSTKFKVPNFLLAEKDWWRFNIAYSHANSGISLLFAICWWSTIFFLRKMEAGCHPNITLSWKRKPLFIYLSSNSTNIFSMVQIHNPSGYFDIDSCAWLKHRLIFLPYVSYLKSVCVYIYIY